jgi:hypothetical protein
MRKFKLDFKEQLKILFEFFLGEMTKDFELSGSFGQQRLPRMSRVGLSRGNQALCWRDSSIGSEFSQIYCYASVNP